MKRTALPRRYSNIAKKTSPSEWLGDFIPVDADEAICFGPAFNNHATEYDKHIKDTFVGNASVTHVRTDLWFKQGRCKKVTLFVEHAFFKKMLVFEFPPMPAAHVVELAWSCIVQAQTRPNVDPTQLAREILAHGWQAQAGFVPQEES